MQQKSIHTLEFPKIQKMLSDLVSSGMGQAKIDEMFPSADFETVFRWQKETSEACALLESGSNPLSGLHDIRAAIKRAELGGVLEGEELLNIAYTLGAARKIRRTLQESAELYPFLNEVGIHLSNHKKLEDDILDILDEKGIVKDHATPELRRLRIAIRQHQQNMKSKMESFIRNPNIQKYLQETIITMRNDRYVIPVKQENRHAVPGIVHDSSNSGATLFIEPMAIVDLNNELRQVLLLERDEVLRILQEISTRIGADYLFIQRSVEALANFDYIFARARLSFALKATEPEISRDGSLKFWQARHPLLKGKVIPIDIRLGERFHVLLITGPNTGGKTVTLKTVGLLNLMGQCGLHIPAEAGSKIGLFDHILADIGDEQSIEQSLSTFSSHMTNIVRIMETATEHSLLLFDELGAGTDPTEGAALAMSILEELLHRQSRVVATTHYSELKIFAYHHEGVENASVEFDIETLRPTYKLMIGIPGRSNAFEIAQRLGLNKEVIDYARSKVGSDQLKVEDMLTLLEENLKQSQQDRIEAQNFKSQWEAEKKLMLAEREDSNSKARERVQRAQSEAAGVIKAARQEAEEILTELRSLRRNISERELTEAAQNSRQTFKRMSGKMASLDEHAQDKTGEPVGDLLVGDPVIWTKYMVEGVVLEEVHGQTEVMIQAGAMKISVPISQLRTGTKKKSETFKPMFSTKKEVATEDSALKTQLDLRGQTLDEALMATDKFLDNAFLAQINKVWIIHGKGTGVLRTGIRDYLKTHPHVKSYVFASFHEGGDGATVVELK